MDSFIAFFLAVLALGLSFTAAKRLSRPRRPPMEPAREPESPPPSGPLDDPFLERLYALQSAVLNAPRVVVPEDLFHVRPFLGLVELLSSPRADVPLLMALVVRSTDAVLG